MSHLFKSVGFEYVLAESGEEAVEMVKEMKVGDIQAVIMDVWMPGIGGMVASREIANMTSHWTVPLLIAGSTADANANIEEECRENGMKYFLPKPVNRQKVQELYYTLKSS